MKTKTINLYTFDELSKEAQEKALKKWTNSNDYEFLSKDMRVHLEELLEENSIKGEPKLYYSLSYSQGDGVIFEGQFEWKKYTVYIKHSGHYYHSNSKTIEIYKGDIISGDKRIYNSFETVYQDICKKLEKYGYDCIEYEDSMESFVETCEANDYTFRENGEMENF